MNPSDRLLHKRLVRVAADMSSKTPGRRDLIKILADFDPNEIGETDAGPLEDGTDETDLGGDFTQSEFTELSDLQESGDLGKEAKDDRALFAGLVRLAHSDKQARGPILTMLREAGYIGDDGKPTTKVGGCEKLPEGGMRENCEKKVEEGKKDDKKAAMPSEDRRVRDNLIRLAHAKPEFRGKILPIIKAYDAEQKN